MVPPAPRIDTASRHIAASPRRIYDAYVDPVQLASWLPPDGMSARIVTFEPRDGGRYAMTLVYDDPGHAGSGKTDAGSDVVRGRFVELVPGERIVQTAVFDSDDPAFAGEMTLRWTLAPADGGTLVTIAASDVPDGITPEDHEAGLTSTLANLAAWVESGDQGR